jgi:hypothetical protein
MSTSLRSANHPIWRIGTIIALVALVWSVNYFPAKKFDKDDWERIGYMLSGLGVGVKAKSTLQKWLSAGGENDG